MYEIKEFQYKKSALDHLRTYKHGLNWPIVYILNGGKEVYIGESTSAYKRANQHLEKPQKAKLDKMFILADDEYNKSATLDIESLLIKYMAGDGKFLLQNSNHGIQDSEYYDKERYRAKFELIWQDLRHLKLADKTLEQIENTDLFKYSPYKSLTED
ncbi:hypothetical protein IT418_02285 [bacterium]|nr:hypothetical protein [bacterium]